MKYLISSVLVAGLVSACSSQPEAAGNVEPDVDDQVNDEPIGFGGAAPVETGEVEAAGGEGGAGEPVPCGSISGLVGDDREIGPGCVDMGRVNLSGAVTLTIAPGTTVRMARSAYLKVGPYATLKARGTAEQPITFTSSYEDPRAGDWQCVVVQDGSADTEIEHAVFEYGGEFCEALGIQDDALLQIGASLSLLKDVTLRHSEGHGLLLEDDAGKIRELDGIAFKDNAKPSLTLEAECVDTLNTSIEFDDEDEYIDVRANDVRDIDVETTFRNVGLPYRIGGTLDVNAPLFVEAGTEMQMAGGVDLSLDASVEAVGTADEPVVWTAPPAERTPGGWGCLDFQYGTATLSHNVVEYAGNCTVGAVHVQSGSQFDNLVFRSIRGPAISITGTCEPDAIKPNEWCDAFEYEDVEARVACRYGNEVFCE